MLSFLITCIKALFAIPLPSFLLFVIVLNSNFSRLMLILGV